MCAFPLDYCLEDFSFDTDFIFLEIQNEAVPLHEESSQYEVIPVNVYYVKVVLAL